MIAWESCEYLHGFEVIVSCFLRVIKIPKMLIQIRVRDGIGNVVLPHLFLPNLYCPCDIFLKRYSFTHADKHCCLFLVYSRENCTTMHVLHLYLCYLLGDLQLFEGEVVFELPVEYLNLQKTDIDIIWMTEEDLIVLSGIKFHQGSSEDLESLFYVQK